ncbi:response regulator transcription factor [Bifidobacterium angulatum]|uniref:response regulator transcription factor n=1 Tax=Bifidobacterium angulatum TaxID=1683 RepID=UPI00265A6968|nr:response regulator transcription factor [Bifidobacterium angulatum]
MKIAIADDDPIVCSSLQTILTASGTADVLWTANDGEETCRQYMAGPAQHPDVLLVDVQMPGLNGIEAARKILEFDKAARILFLTTFADQQYISQAMALGARGYLIKQDVASVCPAVQAVMAGQIVLGAEVLGKLTGSPSNRNDHAENRHTENGYGDGELANALATLSERERDVARLVAQGLDNRQIAAQLFLSEGTVRNRISDILDKLALTNRTQLAIAWLHAER